MRTPFVIGEDPFVPGAPRPRNENLLRQAAIAAARGRYEGKDLVWGTQDCARLTACVLQHLGLQPGLARLGRYTSAVTAMRRLRAQGVARAEDWLDGIAGLDRQPFSWALPGDILALPSDTDWPALAVFLGGDKALAFGAVVDAETGLTASRCTVGAMNVEPLIHWKVTCRR